jgi:hypothetical protein
MSAPSKPTTGVRDPENPDQWLVSPWPAQASFCDVVQHFQWAGLLRLPNDSSTARHLAFNKGFQAALAVAHTNEFEYQAQWNWRGYMLDCVDRCVNLYGEKYVAEYGRDPQEGEDQHTKAVKQRTGTR